MVCLLGVIVPEVSAVVIVATVMSGVEFWFWFRCIWDCCIC